MKTKYFKPLIISLFSAIAFGSIGIGTSFALFMDTSETNVEVSSGRIQAESRLSYRGYKDLAVENDPLLTYGEYDVNDTRTSVDYGEAGGHVSILSDGLSLSIENMIPGDTIYFGLSLKNKSSINAKYRLRCFVTGEANAEIADLISINAVDSNSESVLGKWQTLDAAISTEGDDLTPLEVSIALPNFHNTLSNLTPSNLGSFSIRFRYEIVQKNARISATEIDAINKIYYAYTADSLKQFRDGYNEGNYDGYTLSICDDIDFAGDTENWTPIGVYNENPAESHPFIGTINGNGHTISNLSSKDTSRLGYSGLVGYAGSDYETTYIKNLILDDAEVEGLASGALVGVAKANVLISNVTINNPTILGTKWCGGAVGKLASSKIFDTTINNASIALTPAIPSGESTYQDGNMGGGLIGYTNLATSGGIERCKVNGLTINGYSDLGAISGVYKIEDSPTIDESFFMDNVVRGNIVVTGDQSGLTSYGAVDFNLDQGTGIFKGIGHYIRDNSHYFDNGGCFYVCDTTNANYDVTEVASS